MSCHCGTCSLTGSCCFCAVQGKPIETIYVDGYGKIYLALLGVEAPPDLYYCPMCKTSPITPHMFLDQVRTAIEARPYGVKGPHGCLEEGYRYQHRWLAEDAARKEAVKREKQRRKGRF